MPYRIPCGDSDAASEISAGNRRPICRSAHGRAPLALWHPLHTFADGHRGGTGGREVRAPMQSPGAVDSWADCRPAGRLSTLPRNMDAFWPHGNAGGNRGFGPLVLRHRLKYGGLGGALGRPCLPVSQDMVAPRHPVATQPKDPPT